VDASAAGAAAAAAGAVPPSMTQQHRQGTDTHTRTDMVISAKTMYIITRLKIRGITFLLPLFICLYSTAGLEVLWPTGDFAAAAAAADDDDLPGTTLFPMIMAAVCCCCCCCWCCCCWCCWCDCM
jgi:hypothetical protein